MHPSCGYYAGERSTFSFDPHFNARRLRDPIVVTPTHIINKSDRRSEVVDVSSCFLFRAEHQRLIVDGMVEINESEK